jgi:hypothetical protein
MRRTVAYGETEAGDWEAIAEAEDLQDEEVEGEAEAEAEADVDPASEGRRAYAVEKALTERATCALLRKKWAGILRKADAYLGDGDAEEAAGQDETVMVELDLGDELEPDNEEALLEREDEEED